MIIYIYNAEIKIYKIHQIYVYLRIFKTYPINLTFKVIQFKK